MGLQLSSVAVRRRGFHLGPVTVRLDPGVTALVGPNGAGKTTLMAAALGLVTSHGQATVDGHATKGASRRDAMAALGYLPQDPHVSRMLTVGQAVAYAAWLKRVVDIPSSVRDALAKVDLSEIRARRIGRLSGGQVQRVCIAQAVVHEPSVLLLDEPTVGLDPQQRTFLYDVIADLAAAGATVLLSTHTMDDVSAVAGRVLVIDEGRLVADEGVEGGSAVERFGFVNALVGRTLGYHR